MAKAFASGSMGALALSSAGLGFDGNSFDYQESQQTESAAVYGAAVYDPHRGSGVPHAQLTANGFATFGASGTTPGFGATAFTSAGGSVTITPATGATLVGPMIPSNVRLSHSRVRGVAPVTATLEGGGDMVTTWPTS